MLQRYLSFHSILGKNPDMQKTGHRVTAAESDKMIPKVRAFLKKHPGSGRRAIMKGASIPSMSAYHRIMDILRALDEVDVHGQGRGITYSLR